jgi:NADPH:quinone reductase-like Zn-dependent oxidoreductase
MATRARTAGASSTCRSPKSETTTYSSRSTPPGVNLLDAKIANGEFKIFLPYRFPLVLGNDVAGVVVEVGARVRRFKPGDEVYPRPDKDRIGTFAEFIAMNEGDVATKPRELTMEEAASIPLVGLTAWQALVEMTNLKPGQKVFIQAGTGGSGPSPSS